jgi:2'-5' RNA ligase
MAEQSPRPSLQTQYDALWDEALPKVKSGTIALDADVLRKELDLRRGITLLARPEPALASRVEKLLDELRAVEPAQYYQPRSDLHLTVLSLFTATAEFEPFLRHLDEYEEAVAEAVDGVSPFAIEVRGMTLTSSAVLAQGFPKSAALEDLRERLRSALTARGLAGGLDQRYRLTTAHMTLVRFANPLRNARRFVGLLERFRDAEIGTWRVAQLELVLGDWYQSRENEQRIAAYSMGQAAPATR